MGLFSGLAGGLFGKTPSIGMPSFDPLKLGLKSKLKTLMKQDYGKFRSEGLNLFSQIPGLITQATSAPTLGLEEQRELGVAEDTFNRILKNAQLNAFNNIAQGIGGVSGTLAQQGVNLQGAAAANMNAGIVSQQQSGLNTMANSISENLLNLRQKLLAGVQNRLINRLEATSSTASSLYGTAQGILGTGLNVSASERGLKLKVDSANAALKSAEQSSSMGLLGNIGGGIIGGMF